MIEAQAYGRAHNIHFVYYCLLSGQDYPLRAVSEINEELFENYPKPYIDCTPCAEGNWIFRGSKHSIFYVRTRGLLNRKLSNYRTIRGVLKLLAKLINNVICRCSNTRKVLELRGVKLFGGSEWWILPDNMVDLIVDVHNKMSKKSKYYPLYFVLTPDECYYQSVLMNSCFSSRIKVNPPMMIEQNCKTYAHFNPEGKVFTGHPYVFTMADKDLLKKLSTEKFFARKFDETVDREILCWVDELGDKE